MRKTIGIVAASTIAGAGLIAASALPGSAAPHAAAHAQTMHFVLHSTAGHNVGPRNFVGGDRVTQHGKVVGLDSYSAVAHLKKNFARLDVSLALRGGLITARVHLNFNQHSTFTGTVLGGTRRYAGATGTVRGHSPTQQSSTTFLTVALN